MNNNINNDGDDNNDNGIIAVERDFTFLSLNPVARKKGWCFVRCLEKKLNEKSNKKRKQKSLFLLFFVQHRHCGGDCQKTGNANKRVWLESLIEEVLFSTQMLLPPFPPDFLIPSLDCCCCCCCHRCWCCWYYCCCPCVHVSKGL